MKFLVSYHQYFSNSSKLKHYNFVTETIEARGIMHAAKLASDHAKELQKKLGEKINVAKIAQVDDK